MTGAAVAAGAAGVCGVGATWELLASIERTRVEAMVRRLVAPLGRPHTVASRVEERRLVRTAIGALLAAGLLLFGVAGGLLLAAVGPWSVRRVLRARRARWRTAAGAGSASVARALADALAAGHSVRGALGQVAAHGGVVGPAGDVLDQARAGLASGDTTEHVLERMRTTVADPSWDTLVAAVLLARDTGGDLCGLLRSLAAAAEAARREEADARTATAQARLTAGIVAALPLGGAALAELADPGLLVDVVADPRSLVLLVLAIVVQGGALLLVRRIARVASA